MRFNPRASYIHHTKVSSILDHDLVFQVNIRALIRTKPDPTTFANVRNHLVRSSVARFRRTKNEMAMARAGSQFIERELAAA